MSKRSAYGTYSFQDVYCQIAGPTLASGLKILELAEGGVAREGITVAPLASKNIMIEGADGNNVHNLVPNRGATVTVRLLKMNSVNAELQTMFNTQTASPYLHGMNIIRLTDTVRGDTIILNGCAFRSPASLGYGREGNENVWEFDCAQMFTVLGAGATN